MTAMESIGSFWKPIFNILEVEGIAAILINAQEVKNLPGRKTDVKDAEWLADLLRHGLLKPSFVKPRDQRELCELTRYRTSLIEERAREFNRIGKVLEGTKIDELKRALNGLVQPYQQMILQAMLTHIDSLSNIIATVDTQIDSRMQKDVELVEALDEITGVGKISAQTIIAEIGTNMELFPSAQNLASWARMCPGQNESAEKRLDPQG